MPLPQNKKNLIPVAVWIGIVLLGLFGRYFFFLLVLAAIGYGLLVFWKRMNVPGTARPFFDFTSTASSVKKTASSMPTFPKPTAKHVGFVLIALVALLIIIDGLVSVPAGHVAVIFDRGRGVLVNEMDEGLHVKIPFWQRATIMDTRLQTFTMSDHEVDPTSNVFGEPIEALTLDGQRVDIDATMQFRIPAASASDIYQTVGLDYTEKVIKPAARSIIRNVITGYDTTQLFTEVSRVEATHKMRTDLDALYAQSNIQLVDVLLRNVRFSENYLKAIEEKQVAQQRIQKAEYEKLEAEKVKERKIIEAEAEAESIRLKGDTLRANPSVIQFEFVQKLAPNIQWGILPDGALPLLDLKSLGR